MPTTHLRQTTDLADHPETSRATSRSALRVMSRSRLNRHTPASLRLRLKSAHRACGHVQGAWWPRSTVLAAELPPLLDAMSARYGDIDAVQYHPHDWTAGTPRHIEHAGRGVRTEASDITAHVVSLIGPGPGRLTLLVVPPYTDAESAYRIVTAAATATNTATPEQLLGEHTPRSELPRDLQLAVQRWECEGGSHLSAVR